MRMEYSIAVASSRPSGNPESRFKSLISWILFSGAGSGLDVEDLWTLWRKTGPLALFRRNAEESLNRSAAGHTAFPQPAREARAGDDWVSKKRAREGVATRSAARST